LATFLSWVYVDRVVVEAAFRPISAWDAIYIYHYALGVGFSATFISIGLIFFIASGMKLASLTLAGTGIALMKFGPADILYYTLFGQQVPKQLEWLDDNKAAVEAQVAVERAQRAGVDLSPYVTDYGLGLSVLMTVAVISVVWFTLFTYYSRKEKKT
ncbi:MAG: hypothetical protein HYU02_08105, partial [Thaumarchaeota archaeon]|nr:hypothetical protein [Nitrososphaerota archaeon]